MTGDDRSAVSLLALSLAIALGVVLAFGAAAVLLTVAVVAGGGF